VGLHAQHLTACAAFLAQRLTGQVANGDLARANFSGDYEPKILRTETIDGEKMYVLELTAVDRGVTYAKSSTGSGNRTTGLTEPSSTRSPSASSRSHVTKNSRIWGASPPTQLVMEDALKKGEVSVLRYSQMTAKDLPDRVFTKQYMDKLNRVD
jgi:hypothetical protein